MIFSLFFILLGAFFISFSLFLFKKGVETKKWHSTTGKISHIGDFKEKYALNGGRISMLTINYSYTVNNKEYQSDRASFKWKNKNINSEKAKYANVSSIKVYYNPKSHKEAVLETGVDSTNYFSILAGIFIFCSGFFLFFNGI